MSAIATRAYPLGKTLVILVVTAIVSIVAAVLVVGIALITKIVDAEHFFKDPIPLAVFGQFISYIPGIYILLKLTPKFVNCSWEDVGLKKPTLKDITTGFIGAIVSLLIVGVIGFVLVKTTGIHMDDSAKLLGSNPTIFQLIILAVVAVVGAPLFEELTFRGIVLNAVKERFGFWPSIIISGLVFSMAHLSIVNIIPLAIVGIILGLAYQRTKNLWTSITMHAVFNAAGISQLILMHK